MSTMNHTQRSLTAACLTLALAACSSAAPTSELDSTTVSDTTCHEAPDDLICAIELAVVAETNAYRATDGKPALLHSNRFSFVSRLWSKVQGDRADIGHERFLEVEGHTPYYETEFGTAPANLFFSAENVLYNSFSATDAGNAAKIAKVISKQWWDSPGHKANMLKVQYTKLLGVGAYLVKDGAWTTVYATQVFGRD
jgi:uncharacterized protein YkwD